MRCLLDTHALLWALAQPEALAPAARDAIAAPENTVYVSVASLWECTIKASLGKLKLPDRFFETLPSAGYEMLGIGLDHLQTYLALPMHHRDPFDRLLVAQAQRERLVLVSRDAEIARYEVEILGC